MHTYIHTYMHIYIYTHLFYAPLLRHSMHFTETPLSIFSLEFKLKSKTNINIYSLLLALPAAQVLVNFVVVKISTSQIYHMFYPYISWNKYHHACTYTFCDSLIL